MGGNSTRSAGCLDSYANFRTAHVGPQITGGMLCQSWAGQWTKGGTSEYDIAAGGKVKKLATGYTKHYKAGELATVETGLGASGTGKKGAVLAWAQLPGSSGSSAVGVPQTLPGTRTLYLSAADGVQWMLDFEQYGAAGRRRLPDPRRLLHDRRHRRPSRRARRYARRSTRRSSARGSAGSHGIYRDGATCLRPAADVRRRQGARGRVGLRPR